MGPVWLIDRWVEISKVWSIFPVLHRDEVPILAKLTKPPAERESLVRVGWAKQIFGPGTKVTDVIRPKVVRRRQHERPRFYGFVPEPHELD